MGSRKYGRAWKRIRDRYISQHKTCEMCIHKAMSNPKHKIRCATEVHHIVPICRGGQHIDANLMALCHSCHSEIHLKEESENE